MCPSTYTNLSFWTYDLKELSVVLRPSCGLFSHLCWWARPHVDYSWCWHISHLTFPGVTWPREQDLGLTPGQGVWRMLGCCPWFWKVLSSPSTWLHHTTGSPSLRCLCCQASACFDDIIADCSASWSSLNSTRIWPFVVNHILSPCHDPSWIKSWL